jgi:hypothetical protein
VWWIREYRPKIVPVGGGELPFTPAGLARYQRNIAGMKDGTVRDDARRICVPDGVPRILSSPYPFKVVQTPGQVTFIYELNSVIRPIRLNAALPPAEELEIFPAYIGHNVARWEGDTLVIDSAGIKEQTFLDNTGVPHSDQMRAEERVKKLADGTLEVIITVTDPVTFTRPWQARFVYDRHPEVQIEHYNCGDVHRDVSHIAGVNEARRARGIVAAKPVSTPPVTYGYGTAVAPPATPVPSGRAIPDFYTDGYAWQSRTVNTMPPLPGSPGARGPVGAHPDHPNFENSSGRPPTPRIANDGSPLLQPWAAAVVKKGNEAFFNGGVRFSAGERCWPFGVPGNLNIRGGGVTFLQTQDEVIMLYERGQIARHIRLNARHSDNPRPGWYGESVGHYEGDTLVIDTIGLNALSFIDTFGIPHTRQLRVIERYRLVDGSPSLITGNSDPESGDPRPERDPYFINPANRVLLVIATIEDPGAFTTAYSVQQLYWPSDRFVEDICAEGNEDRFNQGLVPIPTAHVPDF